MNWKTKIGIYTYSFVFAGLGLGLICGMFVGLSYLFDGTFSTSTVMAYAFGLLVFSNWFHDVKNGVYELYDKDDEAKQKQEDRKKYYNKGYEFGYNQGQRDESLERVNKSIEELRKSVNES